MSKRRRRSNRDRFPRSISPGGIVGRHSAPTRRAAVAVAIVVTCGVAAGAVLLGNHGTGATGSPPPGAAPASHSAANAPAVASALEALRGRWLRPDGGYVLEIRSIDPAGAIEAAYLNPRPINVARAEATLVESTPKVFVELRAPGYPGSTYALTYDAQHDQLAGVYFQATLQQSFDVVFDRIN